MRSLVRCCCLPAVGDVCSTVRVPLLVVLSRVVLSCCLCCGRVPLSEAERRTQPRSPTHGYPAASSPRELQGNGCWIVLPAEGDDAEHARTAAGQRSLLSRSPIGSGPQRIPSSGPRLVSSPVIHTRAAPPSRALPISGNPRSGKDLTPERRQHRSLHAASRCAWWIVGIEGRTKHKHPGF